MDSNTLHEVVNALREIAQELHELNENLRNSNRNCDSQHPAHPTRNSEKLTGFDASGFRLFLQKKGASSNTVESYTARVARFFERFPEITIDNLAQFEESLKTYSAKTVNLTVVAMNKYFAYIGYTEHSFTRVKEQKQTFCDNALNEEQYNKLIGWSKQNNLQVYKIVKITGSTGVRVSELINLKTSDLERGHADIVGKGNKTRRIYFPESLARDVLPYCTGTYLIENRNGKQITTRGVAELLARAGKRCGLPKEVMHPHSLRHFFAKQFLKEKNDITLLGDLLGHSNVATTAIYTRMTSEEQKNQIDNIVSW